MQGTKYVVTEPGTGSSSTVQYNPDFAPGPPGTPTNFVLAHELDHSVHNAEGTNLGSYKYPDARDNAEEAQTIGAPPYDSDSNTEKTYLKEQGSDYYRKDHSANFYKANEAGEEEKYAP